MCESLAHIVQMAGTNSADDRHQVFKRFICILNSATLKRLGILSLLVLFDFNIMIELSLHAWVPLPITEQFN